MRYTTKDAKKIIANKIKVYSISQIGEGNHSQAFLVNDSFVIKLPKHKKASECLKNEIKVLNALRDKTDLSIPTVEFIGNFKKKNEEFIFYASKMVNGNKLNKYEFLKLDSNKLNKNAEKIAKFLIKIHSFKYVLNGKRKDYCLLHGDFSLNHCLFDENDIICGVLDFADARLGKFTSDFVYLLDDEDEEEFGAVFGNLVLNKYKEFQKEELNGYEI